MRGEDRLQKSVCQYLSYKYPDVVFTSDLSGIKLSIGSALKAKQTRCKYKIPDLLVLHPSVEFKAMFLELKSTRDDLYTKDGKMRDTDHLREQQTTLNKLARLGYYATFACGIDDAIKKIDWYFKQ